MAAVIHLARRFKLFQNIKIKIVPVHEIYVFPVPLQDMYFTHIRETGTRSIIYRRRVYRN